MQCTINVECPCSFKTNVAAKLPTPQGKSYVQFVCETCRSKCIATLRRDYGKDGQPLSHLFTGRLSVQVRVQFPSEALLNLLEKERKEKQNAQIQP